MVLVTRLELVQCCHRGILSPLRLPIPPHQQLSFVCPNRQPSFRFAIYPSAECIRCIWWKMSESNRYSTSQMWSVTVTLHSPYGGESGIRTHGTLQYDGFQDRSVTTASVSLRIIPTITVCSFENKFDLHFSYNFICYMFFIVNLLTDDIIT